MFLKHTSTSYNNNNVNKKLIAYIKFSYIKSVIELNVRKLFKNYSEVEFTNFVYVYDSNLSLIVYNLNSIWNPPVLQINFVVCEFLNTRVTE